MAGIAVVWNIDYTPAEVSGNLKMSDLASAPLQIKSIYESVNDNGNTFAEPCAGSADGCPFNSVFATQVLPPALPGGDYMLFLQPGSDYQFLTQAITVDEGPLAQSITVYNGGEHIGSLAAGASVVKNPAFAQKASVSGHAAFSQPIYNFQVDITGTSTTFDPVLNAQLPFYESYVTQNFYSGLPLPAPVTYLSRVFDNADFSKGMTIRPLFTLSADGGSLLQYPAIPLTLAPGEQKVLDFNNTSTSITGKVTFDPPYPAANIYPGVQAEGFANGGYGLGQTRLQTNAQGGVYSMPVFPGDWDYWRFGWDFNLGDPNFSSNFFVSQFLNIHVNVPPGGTVQKDFPFDTALLKTFFSAPPNTTLSNPQLDTISGTLTNGVFTPDFLEQAHAEGKNQTAVATAEARMVLRVHPNVAYKVTPSAVINLNPNTPATNRTDFSPFIVAPKKGDVTIAGIPGSLSLTVNSPADGQTFQTCSIPVNGTATGAQNITITVNGQIVPALPAGNPNDPLQVTFSTTLAGGGNNMSITVKATAPNNTAVTNVLHVSALTAKPVVSASVSTTSLWPPQHDLVDVGLSAAVSSGCDAQPVLGVTVYSNESDTAETGTGNFSPDAKDPAPGALRLRSERQGNGDGRVYLIVAQGSDHFGNSAAACASVVVPQSQSAASVAQVNAMAASAVATCKAGGVPAGYVQVGVGPAIGPKQ